MTKKQNFVERFIGAIDRLQQRHGWLAFPYAVIKKYGDEDSGYYGALLTYYGFLSLFPLLIIATSVIDIFTRGNEALRDRLINSIYAYFPSIGDDLQASIHSPHVTGIAVISALLFTFYGARGVANATQYALNSVWHVPKSKRAGFPKNTAKSFALIIGGGIGFLGAAVLSSYATAAFQHSLFSRLVPITITLLLLFAVFVFVFRIGLSSKHHYHDLLAGAAVASIGMLILLTIGGYLITHQLHRLTGLYGRFGFILVLLFWIYLQAQVFLYAAQFSAVKALRLWPRSITNNPPTPADEASGVQVTHA